MTQISFNPVDVFQSYFQGRVRTDGRNGELAQAALEGDTVTINGVEVNINNGVTLAEALAITGEQTNIEFDRRAAEGACLTDECTDEAGSAERTNISVDEARDMLGYVERYAAAHNLSETTVLALYRNGASFERVNLSEVADNRELRANELAQRYEAWRAALPADQQASATFLAWATAAQNAHGLGMPAEDSPLYANLQAYIAAAPEDEPRTIEDVTNFLLLSAYSSRHDADGQGIVMRPTLGTQAPQTITIRYQGNYENADNLLAWLRGETPPPPPAPEVAEVAETEEPEEPGPTEEELAEAAAARAREAIESNTALYQPRIAALNDQYSGTGGQLVTLAQNHPNVRFAIGDELTFYHDGESLVFLDAEGNQMAFTEELAPIDIVRAALVEEYGADAAGGPNYYRPYRAVSYLTAHFPAVATEGATINLTALVQVVPLPSARQARVPVRDQALSAELANAVRQPAPPAAEEGEDVSAPTPVSQFSDPWAGGVTPNEDVNPWAVVTESRPIATRWAPCSAALLAFLTTSGARVRIGQNTVWVEEGTLHVSNGNSNRSLPNQDRVGQGNLLQLIINENSSLQAIGNAALLTAVVDFLGEQQRSLRGRTIDLPDLYTRAVAADALTEDDGSVNLNRDSMRSLLPQPENSPVAEAAPAWVPGTVAEENRLDSEATEALVAEDYVRAAELYGQAYEELHNPIMLCFQADCYLRLGRLDDADALLQQVIVARQEEMAYYRDRNSQNHRSPLTVHIKSVRQMLLARRLLARLPQGSADRLALTAALSDFERAYRTPGREGVNFRDAFVGLRTTRRTVAERVASAPLLAAQ